MTASAPELADELALTSVELDFLPERRMALDNLERAGPICRRSAAWSTR